MLTCQPCPLLSRCCLHCRTRPAAVRYFTESHEMQLQHTPGVRTVANLVKEVRRRQAQRFSRGWGMVDHVPLLTKALRTQQPAQVREGD